MKSGSRTWWLNICSILVICGVLGTISCQHFGVTSHAAFAQSADPDTAVEPESPIAVLCIASVDRVLGDIDFLFEAAGRPEFSDLLGSFLANIRDFKGLDRKMPLGVMAFIDPTVDLKPVPVAYFPVQNITELIQTIADASGNRFSLRKVDGDDIYELVTPRNTLPVRLQGGYAFVAQDPQTLAQDMIDPAVLTESLAARYDVAGSVSLKRVPQALRMVFAQSLRASAEAKLQQHDGESDARYRLRRANGDSLLEILDLAINEGQVLNIGWNLSATDQTAALEAELEVTPDSQFAEYLQDIAGRPSQFDNLLNDEAPFAFSTSWSMAKPGKKVFNEIVNSIESEMSKVDSAEADSSGLTPVKRLASVFRDTAEGGHLDLFVQMRQEEADAFVLVGAIKVTEGAKAEQAIAAILQNAKAADKNVAELQLNAATHKGITLHRIRGGRSSKHEERLYGTTPSLYAGGGDKALWFAVGGPQAFPALRSAIDQAQAAPRVTDQQNNIPFRFAINMTSWSAMSNSQSPPSVLAKSAFAADNDALRIDLRPTENGARLHVEFERGFIRFVGLAIAQRLDKRLQF